MSGHDNGGAGGGDEVTIAMNLLDCKHEIGLKFRAMLMEDNEIGLGSKLPLGSIIVHEEYEKLINLTLSYCAYLFNMLLC